MQDVRDCENYGIGHSCLRVRGSRDAQSRLLATPVAEKLFLRGPKPGAPCRCDRLPDRHLNRHLAPPIGRRRHHVALQATPSTVSLTPLPARDVPPYPVRDPRNRPSPESRSSARDHRCDAQSSYSGRTPSIHCVMLVIPGRRAVSRILGFP